MKSASTANRGLQVLLVSLIVLVLIFVWLLRFAYGTSAPGREESLSSVYALAARGEITSATLLDEDAQIVGTRCVAQPGVPASSAPNQCPGTEEQFHVSYPRSDVATQQLIERMSAPPVNPVTPGRGGAKVVVDKQSSKAMAKLMVTFVLPLVMLANLFGIIFLSRSGEGSIADIAGFGQIGRNRQRKRHSGTGVSFSNVAGAEEAVAELKEVTDYLSDPKRFEAFGASPPKGVLLFGPPGCGKTLLARAVAGESGVPFFSISGAEFVESLVGVGAARVRDLFRQVRAVAPAIVFIDEIDAVGRRRAGEGFSGGEREQTVNQLLMEMDGFEVTAGIVVMGATNRPDILDPALVRPGRFDRHVTLEAPDVHGRQAILELHAAGRPMALDVDLEAVARRTPGFTGADLANVINEGALLALRQGEGIEIAMVHLSEAIQRVRYGPQRRGRLLSAEERKRLAFHESGHALVAAALGRRGELSRVSIVARGRGLGQTVVSDEEDRAVLAASEIEAQLAVALGGLAAEELHFGEPSTTADDDLAKANHLAREMVGRYGMSAELGRLRVFGGENGYLGQDGAVMDSVSGQTMQVLDQEVKELMATAEVTAIQVLERHQDTLRRMAEQLEAEETLEANTLDALLAPVRPEANLPGNGQVSPAQRRAKVNRPKAKAAAKRRAPAKRRSDNPP